MTTIINHSPAAIEFGRLVYETMLESLRAECRTVEALEDSEMLGWITTAEALEIVDRLAYEAIDLILRPYGDDSVVEHPIYDTFVGACSVALDATIKALSEYHGR